MKQLRDLHIWPQVIPLGTWPCIRCGASPRSMRATRPCPGTFAARVVPLPPPPTRADAAYPAWYSHHHGLLPLTEEQTAQVLDWLLEED